MDTEAPFVGSRLHPLIWVNPLRRRKWSTETRAPRRGWRRGPFSHPSRGKAGLVVEDGFPKSPPGADAAGLEDYGVELRGGGRRMGTIVSSVEEGGQRLVVETGLPPFKRDRRAIPWSEIERVDHDALLVTFAARTAGTFPRLPAADREDEAPASSEATCLSRFVTSS